MSGRNVEIVRGIWKAWEESGDLDSLLDSVLAVVHEDVEWHSADDEPDAGTRRGIAEIRAGWEEWMSIFADFQVEPRDFIEAGDSVIVPLRYSGRPRDTEARVAADETWVLRFRDGMICEGREYRTIDAAYASLGVDDD